MGLRLNICTAVIAVAFIATPAHAGFDDFAAADTTNPPTTNELAADSQTVQQLFDLPDELTSEPHVPLYAPPAVDSRPLPAAVTAPLPPALLPGAALILGNWVFAKKLKKRLK